MNSNQRPAIKSNMDKDGWAFFIKTKTRSGIYAPSGF